VIPEPGTRIRLTGYNWPPEKAERVYEPVSWGYDCVYIMYGGKEICLNWETSDGTGYEFEFVFPCHDSSFP